MLSASSGEAARFTGRAEAAKESPSTKMELEKRIVRKD